MTSRDPPIFGEKEADALLEAGWGQAQILRPTEDLPQIAADSFFVVCTQSCSVVSPDLVRDPLVEVAEAKVVERYSPRSDQARGKNVRKFHIPVGGADFAALEVNINCRHFVKRELLLTLRPAGFTISDIARREFAGWLARYYSRVALPNELVSRLQKTVFVRLKAFLDEKIGKPPAPRHEHVSSMYVRFEPDAEIAEPDAYGVDFMILCDSPEVADAFDDILVTLFGGRKFSADRMELTFAVTTPEETLLSDLQGWHRFSEWDHLSGMWETATAPSA